MQKYLEGYIPKIMIIDDVEQNIQMLAILLQDNNYEIEAATNAKEALKQLEKIHPDLILLDIMMPDINGFSFAKIIKNNPDLSDIPIIFLTASAVEEDILHGFEVGGVDYITKPFNKKELLARVKTHIDLKLSKEVISRKMAEISKINAQLEDSKQEIERYYRLLNNEIIIAADYVYSLLPNKITNDIVETDWIFLPSQKLGGDSFGYNWIDEDNFAIYFLDVSGHGVASALQSVSVLNMLRFRTLPDIDFHIPEKVFDELNKAFPIQKHNFLFFTIFYALFNKKTRKMKYSGAGNPPVFLTNGSSPILSLESQNILIGTDENAIFTSAEIDIPEHSTLYIYSDGITDPSSFDLQNWNEDKLLDFFLKNANNENMMQDLIDFLKNISKDHTLKDDISILKVKFN
ncbi:MAG: SpoIIE family protein phosphatase [Chloroherpetonaceae bacterium]|nr:SpoIIE family protein phosphatase [bacterium]